MSVLPAMLGTLSMHDAVLLISALQVENHLSHAPLGTRKVARALAVFLLSYFTAYMETLTISHVSTCCKPCNALHVCNCTCVCWGK